MCFFIRLTEENQIGIQEGSLGDQVVIQGLADYFHNPGQKPVACLCLFPHAFHLLTEGNGVGV